MNKNVENKELDIPADDLDCWYRYPKHRWVYDLSRLLDSQNIEWSIVEQEDLHKEVNIQLYTNKPVIKQPGYIYIKPPEGNHLFTECYISKGEIKLMRHLDPKTSNELVGLVGGVELRLYAFVTLHFSKFTGVITTETYGADIYRVRLKPHSELSLEDNSNISKITKRIYKKNEITLNGPSDRALHSELAS